MGRVKTINFLTPGHVSPQTILSRLSLFSTDLELKVGLPAQTKLDPGTYAASRFGRRGRATLLASSQS